MFNESLQAHTLLDEFERLKAAPFGQTPDFPVPDGFDEIVITYDGRERMELPIPVRKDGKCCLIATDGSGKVLSECKYDLLFREPFVEWVNYIALKDGKYGILDIDGREVVPCVMDAIYERQDPDGVLPLEKDGLWGIYADDEAYIYPRFDELEIYSEDYIRVRSGDLWGWLDAAGNLTTDKSQAFYGSWYDAEK